jgi:hypothetical protein
MISVGTGCSKWPKASEDWSVSSGVATPLVVESVASNAAAPFVIDEESPATHVKAERTSSKRKLKPGPDGQTLCTRGGEHRTLEVVRHGLGCRLSYRSRAHVENVAEAIWGKQVCQHVRSQIVQKLKSAGYSCS